MNRRYSDHLLFIFTFAVSHMDGGLLTIFHGSLPLFLDEIHTFYDEARVTDPPCRLHT